MKRLEHFQTVEVTPAQTIRAKVVGLDRRQIALFPLDAVDVLWLPPESHNVLMLFSHDRQRIALKGSLYHRGTVDELGFVVTDEFCSELERSSRVPLCAPIRLQPRGADGKPTGPAVDHQTADCGADGAILEQGCPLPAGTVVDAELAMPETQGVVEATALLEHDVFGSGGLNLRWITIAAVDRARLHRHVVGELRSEARRNQEAKQVAYVW